MIEAGLLILIACLIAVIVRVTMRLMWRDAIDLGSWPFLPAPEYMTADDIKNLNVRTAKNPDGFIPSISPQL